MALTLQTWNEIVTKKLVKSSSFNNLDAAVRAYLTNSVNNHPRTMLQADKDKFNQARTQLRQNWAFWIAKLAGEHRTYKTSKRYVGNGALEAVAQICRVVEIIDGKNDPRTIPQIFSVLAINDVVGNPQADFDQRPPFVRIGNVFVSVTILGDNSWRYIPEDLETTKSFKVFAGRHGNYINPIDLSGKLLRADESNGHDSVNPALDQAIANKLNRPPRPRVEVIDVRDDGFRTSKGLKNKIKFYIKAGNCVILAWCYGLYTFCESNQVGFGDDVSNPIHPMYAEWQRIVGMKVSDIVKRDWNWA